MTTTTHPGALPGSRFQALSARLLRDFGHEHVDFTVAGSGSNGANPPTTRPGTASSSSIARGTG